MPGGEAKSVHFASKLLRRAAWRDPQIEPERYYEAPFRLARLPGLDEPFNLEDSRHEANCQIVEQQASHLEIEQSPACVEAEDSPGP